MYVKTHWSLSFCHAADSAAKRIRNDYDKANRVPTDPNTRLITIYVIGYSGNGGVDQGLLKRMADDKGSSAFTKTEPIGLYVPIPPPCRTLSTPSVRPSCDCRGKQTRVDAAEWSTQLLAVDHAQRRPHTIPGG